MISPRLLAHRKFLASLNDVIERPVLIPFEEDQDPVGAAAAYTTTYNVPSDKDLFVYALTGAIEVVPSALANYAEDRHVNLADEISFQITVTPSNITLFSAAITMAQVIPTYKRPKEFFKLPAVWRIPASSTITVNWTTRAVAWWTGFNRRFGITLIGEFIRQAELLAYAKV